MDIILGRGGDQGQGHSGGTRGQGLFENIKEKAKSVTKRNFLWDYYEQHLELSEILTPMNVAKSLT